MTIALRDYRPTGPTIVSCNGCGDVAVLDPARHRHRLDGRLSSVGWLATIHTDEPMSFAVCPRCLADRRGIPPLPRARRRTVT